MGVEELAQRLRVLATLEEGRFPALSVWSPTTPALRDLLPVSQLLSPHTHLNKSLNMN